MSARPGRIIDERVVDLPRPRKLEVTYEPYSVALVHALRDRISAGRMAELEQDLDPRHRLRHETRDRATA